MNEQALRDHAVAFYRAGNWPEAERACAELLRLLPGDAGIHQLLGMVCAQTGRFAEALANYDEALKSAPNFVLHYNRGLALRALGRPQEAVTNYDGALALNPSSAEAWNARGLALYDMNLYGLALDCFDRADALKPGMVEILYNRGNVLQELKRSEEALASYDTALLLRPDMAEIWNNRGIALHALRQFREAQASFGKALIFNPKLFAACKNLGAVLCEDGRTEEGLRAFTRHAEMTSGLAAGKAVSPHKARHDAEQREYLGVAPGDETFHLADGSRLAGPAINPKNTVADISEQWRTSNPQIVVVDDLLTPEALEKLRRFCLGSTVWWSSYPDGYLGAMSEYGFACPLLAQIADELRQIYPAIFHSHPLRYLWAFKYDSNLNGIGIHADEAAVNVNFWITPDEANLDPESGGLVVWDAAAPLDWDFEKFNRDTGAMREFLAQNNAKAVTIPYRANRAVIFDSDLFHATDTIKFKDGYLNRRINVTLLYGRREGSGE